MTTNFNDPDKSTHNPYPIRTWVDQLNVSRLPLDGQFAVGRHGQPVDPDFHPLAPYCPRFNGDLLMRCNLAGVEYIDRQVLTLSVPAPGYTSAYRMDISLRFDDSCRNGHESFAATAEVYHKGTRARGHEGVREGGCLHELIVRAVPKLEPFLKWHLCSTDGPMHYVANACYLASTQDWNGRPKLADFDGARRSAIWPDAPDEVLASPRAELEGALLARLPQLAADLKADMVALGFVWPNRLETQ